MAKNLHDAIDEHDKDIRSRIVKAAKQATEDAKKDIKTHANICLAQYYDDYDPLSYERSHALKQAIVPHSHFQDNGDHLVCTAGIEFNADILKAYVDAQSNYAYDASQKYGRVDGDWVIENYLAGIHPTTNGSSIPDEVIYTPKQIGVPPDEKMKQHLDRYHEKFKSNLFKYMRMHR